LGEVSSLKVVLLWWMKIVAFVLISEAIFFLNSFSVIFIGLTVLLDFFVKLSQ
jgi:hypothetical protein